MHSVDERILASHVHERTTGATCACLARNRNLLQRRETTEDVHSFVCTRMRELQSLRCVVAVWELTPLCIR
jgi:hypothetical protein